MALLRHAQTSHILYEGTPAEAVLMAQKLGLEAQVVGVGEEPTTPLIYDGLGLGFDPEAVLDAHRAQASQKPPKDAGDDLRDAIKDTVGQAKATEDTVAQAAPEARAAYAEAAKIAG